MKHFANLWALLRTWTFDEWVWRLSVLWAPWQTRWFGEAPMVGGFVWEQGRSSLYLCMVLMAMYGARALYRERVWKHWTWRSIGLCGLGMVFLVWPTLGLRASMQWVVQVAVLATWVWALRRSVRRNHLQTWIVVSLIPPTLFGVWQSISQEVFASTWLGIAAQDPLTRGVSVVQVGAERVLRAYGSFPHPNIFGAWMAFVVLLAVSLSRDRRWMLAMLPIISVALYLSFSRAAWIAVCVGLGVLSVDFYRARAGKLLAVALMCIVLPIAGAIAVRPSLAFTRVSAVEHLETKSLNDRQASLRQGFSVIGDNIWGTGLGAYRVGLERVCAHTDCRVPFEPPHAAPLLALAELGWLRVLVLLGAVLCVFRKRIYEGEVFVRAAFVALFSTLAVFDHYLWSLWAGQTLVAMLIVQGVMSPRTPITFAHSHIDRAGSEG